MDRPRDADTTHGYPKIWRVELEQELLKGKQAYCRVIDYKGGPGETWEQYQTSQRRFLLYDPLRRFHGEPGSKWWAIRKLDSRRLEVLGPAEQEEFPALVRFELVSTLARGGTAQAVTLVWDDDLLPDPDYVPGTAITVEDFSRSVPTSLGAGTRGLAVEFTDKPESFLILEIERALVEGALIRVELTTELFWGGSAQAKRVVWNGNAYVADGDPLEVRDFTGHRWQGQAGYRGWALQPADRQDQWELVQLDNIAEEIEGTLAENVTADNPPRASCAVSNHYRGMDPGTTVTVYDTHEAFANHLSGARFKATWNEKATNAQGDAVGRYEFTWIQPPARFALGKTTGAFTTSSQSPSVEIQFTWDGQAHDEGQSVAAENPVDYTGTNPYLFEAAGANRTCHLTYDVEEGKWRLTWVAC